MSNRWALFTFIYNCEAQCQTGGHHLHSSTVVVSSVKQVGTFNLFHNFGAQYQTGGRCLHSSTTVEPRVKQVGTDYRIPQLGCSSNRWFPKSSFRIFEPSVKQVGIVYIHLIYSCGALRQIGEHHLHLSTVV